MIEKLKYAAQRQEAKRANRNTLWLAGISLALSIAAIGFQQCSNTTVVTNSNSPLDVRIQKQVDRKAPMSIPNIPQLKQGPVRNNKPIETSEKK